MEALVGAAPITYSTGDIDDSLSRGARDIIQRVLSARPEDAWLFTASTAVTTAGLEVENSSLQDVSRGSRACILVPPQLRHQSADKNSLAYATSEFPVFYLLNGKVFILPEPGAGADIAITAFATWGGATNDDGTQTKITAVAHGFHEQDQVVIAQADEVANDIKYVGGYYIYDIIDDDNFIVNKNYDDTEAITGYTVSEPTALCQHVSFPDVANTDVDVANFPSSYYGAIVLYGAMDVVMRLMADVHTDSPTLTLPAIPVAPSLKILDDTVPVFVEPAPFVAPAFPSDISIDLTTDIPATPSYESVDIPVAPSLVFPIDSISIDALDLQVELPVPPPDASLSVGASNFSQPRSVAPIYIKPVYTAPAFPTLDDVVLPSLPVAPALEFSEDGTTTQADNDLAEYIPPVLNAPEWANVDVAVVDEDPEMVSAKLSKVQAQISEFQTQLQAALNSYQRDYAIYEKKFQQATGNIQGALNAENQKNQSKLAKYSSELQSYQMDSQNVLQKWDKDNIQVKYTKWVTQYQNTLQEYQQEIAQALNTFQADSAIYNAEVQKAMQDATNVLSSENQEYSHNLNKYGQELQSYQAKTAHIVAEWSARIANKGMTEFTTKRNDAFQEWNARLSSELGMYSNKVTEKNTKFQNILQNWQAEVNKRIQKYQAETGYDIQIITNELSAASQKFQSDLSKQDGLFKNQLEAFQRKSGEVRAENQEELSKYTAVTGIYSAEASTLIGEFNANVQSLGQQYQWYLTKMQTLQAKYEGYFLLSPAAQQQQQGAKDGR